MAVWFLSSESRAATFPSNSFSGCPGDPIQPGRCPFMGEPGETDVQNGSDDSANDWGCHVQPGIAEIAGRDHRAKRPRRIEGGAREVPTHEDIKGQRHSDRQRCEAAGATRNGGAEYDRDQEKGEHGFDHEACSGRDRESRGAQSEVLRECRRAEAGLRAAQYGRQKERPDDTADELTDDIADRLADAHRAGGEHTDSDRGVKMPARHGAVAKAKAMMGTPWANALATIPGMPTPSPTTAAAPAPMNTNAKVPMNSARSFGAIRLDIVDSRDEIDSRRDQVSPRTMRWLG